MDQKKINDFDEWWSGEWWSRTTFDEGLFAAEAAWNYQQKRIDELVRLLMTRDWMCESLARQLEAAEQEIKKRSLNGDV